MPNHVSSHRPPLDLRLIRTECLLQQEDTLHGRVLRTARKFDAEVVEIRALTAGDLGDGLFGLIDGHHRRAAAMLRRSAGVRVVPVNVFADYVGDKRITARDAETSKPYDKEEIVERMLEGRRFPPHTTLHTFRFNGGRERPFHHYDLIEPMLLIPRRELDQPGRLPRAYIKRLA